MECCVLGCFSYEPYQNVPFSTTQTDKERKQKRKYEILLRLTVSGTLKEKSRYNNLNASDEVPELGSGKLGFHPQQKSRVISGSVVKEKVQHPMNKVWQS